MQAPDRIYAIGDVHGHLDKLKAIHADIAADVTAVPVDHHAILHIGDYTDRGPDSRGVIDYLIAGADEPWINLYGNHDRMVLRFLAERGGADPLLRSDLYWLHPRLGGDTTLRSYGVDVPGPDELESDHGARLFEAARDAIPQTHMDFLKGLRLSYHWRDFFFTHAGVMPGIPLAEQVEDDLIWIRKPFHDSDADHGAVIVHGHTPVDAVEDHGNRIAIDTGAAYGGPLSCVVFEGGSVRQLGGDVLR